MQCVADCIRQITLTIYSAPQVEHLEMCHINSDFFTVSRRQMPLNALTIVSTTIPMKILYLQSLLRA